MAVPDDRETGARRLGSEVERFTQRQRELNEYLRQSSQAAQAMRRAIEGSGNQRARRILAGQWEQRRVIPFGVSPGRYAIQMPAIGGWITVQDRDHYGKVDQAAEDAEKMKREADRPVRVVDQVLRVCVWPPEEQGKKM